MLTFYIAMLTFYIAMLTFYIAMLFIGYDLNEIKDFNISTCPT